MKKFSMWKVIQDNVVISEEASPSEISEMILDGRIRSNAIVKQVGKEKERNILHSPLASTKHTGGLINPDSYFIRKGMFWTAGALSFIGASILIFKGALEDGLSVVQALLFIFLYVIGAVALANIPKRFFKMHPILSCGISVIAALGIILVFTTSGNLRLLPEAIGAYVLLMLMLFIVALIPGAIVGIITSNIYKSRIPEVPSSFWVEEKKPIFNLEKAFIFWLIGFAGLCGLHRFYLRRKGTAILWLLTVGLFFIGQLIDLFLLRRMVEQANKEWESR